MSNRILKYGEIISIGKTTSGIGVQHLVAESNSDVNFNRTNSLQWEHFMILNSKYPTYRGYVYGNDKVSLLSWHGKYLSYSTNSVKANGDEIGDDKIWTIRNHAGINGAINVQTPISGSIQGYINLRSSNNKWISRTNNGDAVLTQTREELLFLVSEKYRSDFKIPQQNKLKFINCCNNKITLPSKYGSMEVCKFDNHDLIIVDLRGIAGEKGYYVGLTAFETTNWRDERIFLPNGNLGNLLDGNWVGTRNTPDFLVINDLISNHYKGGVPPINSLNPSHQNLVYKLQVSIGETWQSDDLFFSVG